MENAPIVNINGDRADDLFAQYIGVANAATDLLDALAKARPHGRNYQLNPEGDFGEAMAAHLKQGDAARSVNEWAQALACSVLEQKWEREGR